MTKMIDLYESTIKTKEQLLKKLQVSEENGLSSTEAQARQKKYGPNEIASSVVVWTHILWRQVKSPFISLLVFAAILALLLGQYLDGLMILMFVFINTFLGFIQEYHSEKTLQLLKQYIVPQVKVLREGLIQAVPTNNLVPGDLVPLTAGDAITADVRFLKADDLLVDESTLTGESTPVVKTSQPLEKIAKQPFEALNLGFSNTTVDGGRALGLVIATGKWSVLGKISRLTGETIRISAFEKEIAVFSKFILRLILVTLSFVFLANIVIKGSAVNFPQLVIFSIALAVSVIPEALPVVITFSLSRGALRLARNKVAVKRLSAIEDLGSIEILCTDKTGTITENRMEVANFYTQDKKNLFFYAGLAATKFCQKLKAPTNTFDRALWKKISPEEQEQYKEYKKLKEIIFNAKRRRDSILIKKGNQRELIVRGAPETIIGLCPGLTVKRKNDLYKWLIDEGTRSLRVLAIAKRTIRSLKNTKIELLEKDLTLLGLISFVDPLKKSTLAAVKQAKLLGIQVKILTGDRREVAGSIARQIGLVKSVAEVISGEEYQKLTDEKKNEIIEEYQVFSRVTPEQKYDIINRLQRKYIVGFLGEGINDAPALKIANVALVVNDAVDVSREAADILLLKKSLKVIIDGIQEGRSIFTNTTKYIKATLASNFGNFYAMAVVSLLIKTLPMLPLQILLLNFLSDFPMIAIATDNADPEELKKPTRYYIKEIALITTILGLVSTVFDFLLFSLLYRISTTIFQTGWFVGSVLTELVFIYSIRTKLAFWRAKPASFALTLITVISVVIAVSLPFTAFGQEIFHFVRLRTGHLLSIFAVVAVYFVVTEITKLLYYRSFKTES
ncbi:MAG TPA: HAD-IC family P-type ATPase [Candidatus Bathyarchaeia archaeon]|nr:HAD-IC family P-type ATPase [Candidatus Bathyarchaeia archaeon]